MCIQFRFYILRKFPFPQHFTLLNFPKRSFEISNVLLNMYVLFRWVPLFSQMLLNLNIQLTVFSSTSFLESYCNIENRSSLSNCITLILVCFEFSIRFFPNRLFSHVYRLSNQFVCISCLNRYLIFLNHKT